MNIIRLAVIILLLASCISEGNSDIELSQNQPKKIVLLENTVNKSNLVFDKQTSIWSLDSLPYSGNVISYYQDSIIHESFGLYKGKKHGKATNYYPDGHSKQVANYNQGILEGSKMRYSSDSTHRIMSHLNYHKGKLHGEQRNWYNTGELFKVLNLNMGVEEGIQQAYRKNGKLFANYEAKEGRIFGLKRAALCFDLENEVVKE